MNEQDLQEATLEQMKAERDLIRDAIDRLIADLNAGPLDDCHYGTRCVAAKVEDRLKALLRGRVIGTSR